MLKMHANTNKRDMQNICLVVIGPLVTVGFAIYILSEYYGQSHWKSEVQALVYASPFILSPWLILFLVARRYPNAGPGLVLTLLFMIFISAWPYYEMLVEAKSGFAFAIVPAFQFIAAIAIWVVLALIKSLTRSN